MVNSVPTFRTFVATFTDFLTVAIHTILYERSIYPQTSFLSTRKYNFAVRQSRHPKVCEWINDAISAVETEILKGSADRIAVVLYSTSDTPLERFMFDVARFPHVSLADIDTPLERTEVGGEKMAILPLADLEEQLRATMSKLANCGSLMKPLPERCTFTVAIELKENSEPPITHPQSWIPTQGKQEKGHSNEQAELSTIPVRTVSAGDMIFECWIEENKDIQQGI